MISRKQKTGIAVIAALAIIALMAGVIAPLFLAGSIN